MPFLELHFITFESDLGILCSFQSYLNCTQPAERFFSSFLSCKLCKLVILIWFLCEEREYMHILTNNVYLIMSLFIWEKIWYLSLFLEMENHLCYCWKSIINFRTWKLDARDVRITNKKFCLNLVWVFILFEGD